MLHPSPSNSYTWACYSPALPICIPRLKKLDKLPPRALSSCSATAPSATENRSAPHETQQTQTTRKSLIRSCQTTPVTQTPMCLTKSKVGKSATSSRGLPARKGLRRKKTRKRTTSWTMDRNGDKAKSRWKSRQLSRRKSISLTGSRFRRRSRREPPCLLSSYVVVVYETE